jgi:hypothetical protein
MGMPFGIQSKTDSRKRKLAAILCLLAVVLLEAPFARAAWISSTMGCCMGDHCLIPSHHHKSANAQNEMSTDCGHNVSRMSDCKISCCKTTDETAISAQQFVMSDLQIALPLSSGTPETSRFVPQMISRFDEPQSPPPRLFPS